MCLEVVLNNMFIIIFLMADSETYANHLASYTPFAEDWSYFRRMMRANPSMTQDHQQHFHLLEFHLQGLQPQGLLLQGMALK